MGLSPSSSPSPSPSINTVYPAANRSTNMPAVMPPSKETVLTFLQAQFRGPLILRGFPDYPMESESPAGSSLLPDSASEGPIQLTLASPMDGEPLTLKLLSDSLNTSVVLSYPKDLQNSAALPSRDVMPGTLCLLLHAIATAQRIECMGIESGAPDTDDICALFEKIVAFERSGAALDAQFARWSDRQYAGLPEVQYAGMSAPAPVPVSTPVPAPTQIAPYFPAQSHQYASSLLGKTLKELGVYLAAKGCAPLEVVVTGLDRWHQPSEKTGRNALYVDVRQLSETEIRLRITPAIHDADASAYPGCWSKKASHEYIIPFSEMLREGVIWIAAATAKRLLAKKGVEKVDKIVGVRAWRELKKGTATALKVSSQELNRQVGKFSPVRDGPASKTADAATARAAGADDIHALPSFRTSVIQGPSKRPSNAGGNVPGAGFSDVDRTAAPPAKRKRVVDTHTVQAHDSIVDVASAATAPS